MDARVDSDFHPPNSLAHSPKRQTTLLDSNSVEIASLWGEIQSHVTIDKVVGVTNILHFYPKVTTLRSDLCYRNSVCRLSVCLSSPTLVHCSLFRELNLSAKFLHRCVHWPSSDLRAKLYGDHPRGTPPSSALNARGVAKYSDFRPIEGHIS